MIVDNVTGLKKEGSDHSARCDVIYFEDFNKDILACGGLRLKSLLEKSFGEVTFGIKYFNYKVPVLCNTRLILYFFLKE